MSRFTHGGKRKKGVINGASIVQALNDVKATNRIRLARAALRRLK